MPYQFKEICIFESFTERQKFLVLQKIVFSQKIHVFKLPHSLNITTKCGVIYLLHFLQGLLLNKHLVKLHFRSQLMPITITASVYRKTIWISCFASVTILLISGGVSFEQEYKNRSKKFRAKYRGPVFDTQVCHKQYD